MGSQGVTPTSEQRTNPGEEHPEYLCVVYHRFYGAVKISRCQRLVLQFRGKCQDILCKMLLPKW